MPALIALFLWGPMAILEGPRAGWFFPLAAVLIVILGAFAYVTMLIAPTQQANFGLLPGAYVWYALVGTLYWLMRRSALART